MARSNLFRLCAAALLTIIPHQPGGAASTDRARHRLVDEVLSPWAGARTPGCAVGVSVDGRVDYARGVGTADLTNDVPITPRTIFHAASISKQFTAFSIGLLEARGRLSYADPVRKFIPELPSVMDAITIDQLIHHTDGLREQGQLLYLAGWRTDDVLTEGDIMWALTRQRRLNFEPGTEVVYGNAAYNLLAVVVQRVTGRTLRQFAATEIFGPLGMSDTRFGDGYAEVVRNRASSYVRDRDGVWTYAPLNIRYGGSTGLLTTVGDLLKWEQNLLDGRVGGTRLVGAMRTSGTLRDGTPVAYGHGLRLRDYRGLPMVSHDGVDAGFRSEGLLFPDQRLAIVTLCNGSTADASRIARRIADGYLGPTATRPELEPVASMAPAEQAALAGTYWSEQTDEVIELRWTGTALRVAGASVDLVPIGNDAFRPEDQPNEWRFLRASGGVQTLSIRDSWPTRRSFARLDAPLPGIDVLSAVAGRYQSVETETIYDVSLVDGRLRLSWPRGNDLALTPVGGNRFTSGVGTVTFVPGTAGAYTGLTISNRRLRRLAADRVDIPRGAASGRIASQGHVAGQLGPSPPARTAPLASQIRRTRTDAQPAVLIGNPPEVAAPIGPYSHLAAVPPGTQLLFIAGQIGNRPDGTVEQGVDAQYEQALRNVAAILSSRGATPDHLVRTTVYLTQPLDLTRAEASRLAVFGKAAPPATLVYVNRLARPTLLVEIEATAAVSTPPR